MTKVRYQRWDVFTNRQFAGNQLAVIPDAANIGSESMQRIANEFALPESTFVVAPTDPACDCRIRIFTPGRELPMAGHPTIGTAFALAKMGRIPDRTANVRVELGIGPTSIDLEWRSHGLGMAWMAQNAPEFGPACDDVRALSRMSNLDVSDIRVPTLPAQVLSSGVPLLFVPMVSRAAVDRAVLDRGELIALCQRLGVPECPVYVFSLGANIDDATAYSRMFAPVFGVAEDPATGGASGPLGAYIAKNRPDLVPRTGQLVNSQGVKMGRPSRIFISLPDANADAASLRVGGEAVYVGEGELHLDA